MREKILYALLALTGCTQKTGYVGMHEGAPAQSEARFSTDQDREIDQQKEKDFVLLSDIDPTIIEQIRYATLENLTGKPVPGYQANKAICTRKAALALKRAHEDFKSRGYTLVVYDAYRPQQAVDAFDQWSQAPPSPSDKKEHYYPTHNKEELFELRYFSRTSGHTRGSTFDLSIIPSDKKLQPIRVTPRTLNNGDKICFLDDNTVDMGASFDLLHPASDHREPSFITEEQKANRDLLRTIMEKHGFEPYLKEWWHYTLKEEPYPSGDEKSYFNFPVDTSSILKK